MVWNCSKKKSTGPLVFYWKLSSFFLHQCSEWLFLILVWRLGNKKSGVKKKNTKKQNKTKQNKNHNKKIKRWVNNITSLPFWSDILFPMKASCNSKCTTLGTTAHRHGLLFHNMLQENASVQCSSGQKVHTADGKVHVSNLTMFIFPH